MGLVKDFLSGSVNFIKEEILPIRGELIKAGLIDPNSKHYDTKASLTDPWATGAIGYGYKEKYSVLDYSKCRQITYADPVVAAILQTRCNQVGAYCHVETDEYKVGFQVKLRDNEKTPTPKEIKRMKEIEQFLLNTGSNEMNAQPEYRRRDDFETFIRKIVRDSLTFDQCNFEITPKNDGTPFSFQAVDASTIRIIPDKKESVEGAMKWDKDFLKDHFMRDRGGEFNYNKAKTPRYAQVMYGMVCHTFDDDELAFGVRNPRSDVSSFGYGFCLHHDSRIATSRGLIKISELAKLGDVFDLSFDGKNYKATAFKTGVKKLMHLHFSDRRTVSASPDHLFYALNNEGVFDWKKLSELKKGDVVACDISVNTGGVDSFSFNYNPPAGSPSKKWGIDTDDSDIWELLGWIVGDGNFRERGGGYAISLFYEKSKEEDILNRHLSILEKYNLPTNCYDARDDIFEVKFNHKGFGEWLLSLGFSTSNGWAKQNRLPEACFTLSVGHRIAFLKALFSADGNLGASNVPFLGCTDLGLLKDVQRLLWSLGIRSKYYYKRILKDMGSGEKEYDDAKLWVYDKEIFFDKIGFFQPHKMPTETNFRGTRASVVGEAFARRIAKDIVPIDRRIRGILSDPSCWGVTREWLESKLDEDSHLKEELRWHHGFVDFVEDGEEDVEMFDLNVQSDFHGFSVDGAVVHNSEIEQSVLTITSHMNAETYNRKFFSQGSTSKGILVFNGSVPPDQLEMFRKQWYQQGVGVNNAWRMPIISLGKDGQMQYQTLQNTNKEMEFGRWLDYCVKTLCAVFQMDPIEIGFDISKQGSGEKGSSGGLGDSQHGSRIAFSQDKGLRPLLLFIQKLINNYIVFRIDPNFEFQFIGYGQDEDQDLDRAIKKLKNYRTINEIREEQDLEPLPDFDKIKNPGDVVLDPSLLQFITTQLQAAQQAEMGEMGGEMGGMGGEVGGKGGPDGEPGGVGAEPDYANMSDDELQQEYDRLLSQEKGGGKEKK